jgi:bisphosphoglycerate-dependent phosphoglycerate mutase
MDIVLNETINKLIEDYKTFEFNTKKYGSKELQSIGSNELRRYLSITLDRKSKQLNDFKFILLSAHDSTVAVLLKALNFTIEF